MTRIKTQLRLLLVLFALLFFSMSAASAPRTAIIGHCSGDDCGCGIDLLTCYGECEADPGPSLYLCEKACRKDAIGCAKGCCG